MCIAAFQEQAEMTSGLSACDRADSTMVHGCSGWNHAIKVLKAAATETMMPIFVAAYNRNSIAELSNHLIIAGS